MEASNTDTGSGPRWSLLDIGIAVIVLILIGNLLMPVAAHVRERARRMMCAHRLRTLGTALHAYHTSFGSFPPAATWGAEGLDLPELLSHKEPTPVHVTRSNWVQNLLPYLDQTELHTKFDMSAPVMAQANADARTTELPLMKCPSDSYNRPDNQYELKRPDATSVHFARGNYAINGGSEHFRSGFGTLANPGPSQQRYFYDEEARTFEWFGNGIAGVNKSFSLDDMTNGQSTTVALEEIRAGIDVIDPRGVWAFGQIGGSITWAHGVTGDDGGPNFTDKDSGPDDILGAPALYKKLGKEFIDSEKMGACSYCDENFQATARSQHPGGVNVMMLDGSVKFVSDKIDQNLWHVMHSRETPPDIFDADRFDQELIGEFDYGEASPESQLTAPVGAAGSKQPKTIQNSTGIEFVRVPSGQFTMGLPNKDNKTPYPDDAVPHDVTISRPFYLGKYEITQQQYTAVTGNNPSLHATPKGDTGEHPVENVTWQQCEDFCRLLSELPEEKSAGRSYRLPTEAEWEWACRGGQQDKLDLQANDESATTAVTIGPSNAFGVHGMTSNVFEWVSDFRRSSYYSESPVEDPQGPETGYLHVIRGWYWVATGPRCKVYVANDPWVGSPFIGFRVVCEHKKQM